MKDSLCIQSKGNSAIMKVCLQVFGTLLQYGKSSMESFVAAEEDACNVTIVSSDVTKWLSCIVDNLDSRFQRAIYWSSVAVL